MPRNREKQENVTLSLIDNVVVAVIVITGGEGGRRGNRAVNTTTYMRKVVRENKEEGEGYAIEVN